MGEASSHLLGYIQGINEEELKEVTSDFIFKLIAKDSAKIISYQQFDSILHSDIIAHVGFKL